VTKKVSLFSSECFKGSSLLMSFFSGFDCLGTYGMRAFAEACLQFHSNVLEKVSRLMIEQLISLE